jgi:hypothetical protein
MYFQWLANKTVSLYQDGDTSETCNAGQQHAHATTTPTTSSSSAFSSAAFEERWRELMDKIVTSDLYDKVMHSEFMDRYTEMYEKVMKSELVDKVMHSHMMEELKALPHEVLEELRALMGEH